MSAAARLFHGVGVRYTLEAGARDPLAGFFDLFPIVQGQAATSADLEIVVRRTASTRPTPDLDAGVWVPFFFHGRIQAYRGTRGLLLSNDVGIAEVSADATRVAIDVERSSPDELVEGLIHVGLLWALRTRGFFDLHAAAICPRRSGNGAIVIAGDSGMGKTTWMLAFVEAGAKYLGDDRVLVRRRARASSSSASEAPQIFSYPRAFHLGPATVRAFPRLARDAVALAHEAKQRLDPAATCADAYDPGGTSPVLFLVPRIEPIATSFTRPLSEADAFGHLLVASAILAVDGMPDRDEHLACLKELVSSTPCYELISGRDLLDDPVNTVRKLEPVRDLVGSL